MANPNLIVLYVENTEASVEFYGKLLAREPAATFPTYAAFELDHGLTLGLWARETVAPTPSETGNRTEFAFMVKNDKAVEAMYADWKALGLTFEQEPTTMTFGRTFVALDPDGHRLRVCPVD